MAAPFPVKSAFYPEYRRRRSSAFTEKKQLSVGGRCCTISLSPNEDSVAVAGREVFRILSLNEKGLQARLNLRPRRANLDYSLNDVHWSPHSNNLVATAATNGAVVVWDTVQATRLCSFSEHHRTVNRVRWHPSDEALLYSAAQDGKVKAWDLRASKCSVTFGESLRTNEKVRDLKVSFHAHAILAAGYEDGVIRLWDGRMVTSALQTVRAHQGLVFSVDWNERDPNLLVSGGMDKHIHIWDHSLASKDPVKVIHTMEPVARVRWNPNGHYLASVALQLDHSIRIWSPYLASVPVAWLPAHSDSLTDVQWLSTGHRMLTCSRDTTVALHTLESAKFPHETLAVVAASWGGSELCCLLDRIDRRRLLVGEDGATGEKRKQFADNGCVKTFVASSALETAPTTLHYEPLDRAWPVKQRLSFFAENYSLSGSPPQELCQHNSAVAVRAEETEAAQIWALLALICSKISPAVPAPTSAAHSASPALPSSAPPLSSSKRTSSEFSSSGSLSDRSSDGNGVGSVEAVPPAVVERKKRRRRHRKRRERSVIAGDYTGEALSEDSSLEVFNDEASSTSRSGGSEPDNEEEDEEEEEEEKEEVENMSDKLPRSRVVSSGMTSESEFSSSEGGPSHLPSERVIDLSALQFDEASSDDEFVFVGNEAAEAALESQFNSSTSLNMELHDVGPTLKKVAKGLQQVMGHAEKRRKAAAVLGRKKRKKRGQSDRDNVRGVVTEAVERGGEEGVDWRALLKKMLLPWLRWCAEHGQTQLCAAVCVVMQSVCVLPSEETIRWMWAYLHLLRKHQLYTAASELVNICNHKKLRMMHQVNVSVTLGCVFCHRREHEPVRYCTRCRRTLATCAVCHLPVQGLVVWCQACGHGGCLVHLRQWFEVEQRCPSGCGHVCSLRVGDVRLGAESFLY